MKIAAILNIHEDSPLVTDTINSIKRWATDSVLVIVDGASWNKLSSVSLPAYKLEGFYHEHNRAPYRNVALAFKNAWDLWKMEVDWYCYLEYDCLFGSDEFKNYLEMADKSGAWCIGNDYREGKFKFPLLEAAFGCKFNYSLYLLGCCVFYKSIFLKKLSEYDFFNRFLNLTNMFSKGFFPGYEEQGGYDLSEHLYPTLAAHLGGRIAQLASWSEPDQRWAGEYKKFTFRFRPEIDPNKEVWYETASILHPLKNFSSPIREYHRNKRKI